MTDSKLETHGPELTRLIVSHPARLHPPIGVARERHTTLLHSSFENRSSSAQYKGNEAESPAARK